MALQVREGPPSPLIPMVVLFILGSMMTVPSMLAYDPNYWDNTVSQVQTHFWVGALMIPVCLLLAVQAFGIPQTNQPGRRNHSSPFVQSVTQNITTSILLVVVIVMLLMLIPLKSFLMAPFLPLPRRW